MIGAYLQNSPSYVIIIFGLWKIGAALVPVNIMYQEQELRHAFESTGVSIVITHSENVDRILKIKDVFKTVILLGFDEKYSASGVIDYDRAVLKQETDCPLFVPEDEDVAGILFTGGVTGKPKAIITTHNGWDKTLSDLVDAQAGASGPFDIADPEMPPNLVPYPLFHGLGQQSLLFAYRVGRSVLLMQRFNVAKFADLTLKYKIRSLVLLPTVIYDLVDYEGRIDLSHVKTVVTGGQNLTPFLKKKFEEKFKIPILSMYGSTESGHVAGWTIKNIKDGLWKPGSTGKVYPGVVVEIRDENDKKLPPGEAGEICVKSKVTVDGYAGEKKESEGLIKNGWIYTGDIGCIDEDNVLFLLGRKRQMIKCGGFQVFPSEIEDVLIKHPRIKELAILGVPDERLGEMPKAYIVLKEKPLSRSQEKEIEKEIMEYCRDNLAHFKTIRAVKFMDQLPRSDAGKVMSAELKKMDQKEQEISAKH